MSVGTGLFRRSKMPCLCVRQASKVHEAVGSGPARGRRQPRAATDPGSEVDPGLSPEEFQRLQMEVEKFGEPTGAAFLYMYPSRCTRVR